MNKSIFKVAFPVISTLILQSTAFAQITPNAIQSLESRGVEIVHEFDAPMDLKGYVGNTGNEMITFYTTGDAKTLIVGTMIDENGQNISDLVIQNEVLAPRLEAAWPRIENSHLVQDGFAGDQPVLYTFTDPNCAYCALFGDQMKSLVDSNEIQFRHIMVGIVAPDSLDKAAMILQSDNAEELLHRQQNTLRQGGISVNDRMAKKGTPAVKENNKLMSDLGFYGTPTTIFKDANGKIRIIRGAAGKAQVEALLEESFQ